MKLLHYTPKNTSFQSEFQTFWKSLSKLVSSKAILSIAVLTLGLQSYCQTTLVPGDIVFTGYNTDDSQNNQNDQFSFLLLTDITANTEVFFTDIGWVSDAIGFQGVTGMQCPVNQGAAADGIVKWVSTSAMSCGDEILINCKISVNANLGSATGFQANYNTGGAPNNDIYYMSLTGESVIAYQGSYNNPSLIAGMSMNELNGSSWPAPSSLCEFTSSDCALPGVLTDYVVALSPEVDNGKYNCTNGTSGSPSAIRDLIQLGTANWITNNTTIVSLPSGCAYACQADAPAITNQPQNVQVCTGLSTMFSITATNTTSYQWQVNTGSGFINASGGNYQNTTSATLTVNNVAGLDGVLFRCVATGSNGSATSDPGVLTVYEPPTITNQPINTTACIGCETGLEVMATGQNLTYQWQVNTGSGFGNISNNSNYSGATSNKLIITNTPVGFDNYSYRVNISGICSPSTTSDEVVLSVTGSATVLGLGEIAIVGYNADGSIDGDDDNFSFVALSDLTAGTEIFFTDRGWMSSPSQFQPGGVASTSGAVSDGVIKWISTTDLACGAEVAINCRLLLTASTGIVIGVDNTANDPNYFLNLSPGGDQIFAYQGSYASPSLISGTNMNGEWDTSLVPTEFTSTKSVRPPALSDGTSALALIPENDNAKYDCNFATSGDPTALAAAIFSSNNWLGNSANLIYPLPIGCNFSCSNGPQITMQPQAQFICDGTSVTFTVAANNVDSYQWQENDGSGYSPIGNGGVYSGVTDASLVISDVSGKDGYFYRCVLTNSIDNTISNGGELTLLSSPILTQDIEAVATCAGCTTGMVIEATGDGLVYQWQVNAGAGFTDIGIGDANYSGADENKLIINNPSVSFDGYLYRCNVTGDCTPPVVSSAIALSVYTGSASVLVPGDVAFVMYNADGASVGEDDNFSFVLLRSITAGTEINFTDRGWMSSPSAFQPGGIVGGTSGAVSDGVIKWISTENLTCGQEVIINCRSLLTSSTGIVIGTDDTANEADIYLSLSSGGDQIFAFQGSYASPTLISGINMNGTWDANLTSTDFTSSESTLPSSLTTGSSAMFIDPELDNAIYDCTNITVGNPELLKVALFDPASWIGNNDTPNSGLLDCGFSCCSAIDPMTIYVDVKANGNKSGDSWSDAFSSLQDALAAAKSCGVPDTIKIANGVYYPDIGGQVGQGNRQESFIIDFVSVIEGGYNSTTGLKDNSEVTILSGNLSDPLLVTDNSQRVIEVLAAATLNGLTIESAYNDSNSNNNGGGIYATDGIFRNLIIRYNVIVGPGGLGGGIYATGNPILLENVLIHNNTAVNYGGGISLESIGGINIFKNVTIADNEANFNGGIDNFNVNVDLFNTIMYHNEPPGIVIFSSTISADHSIIESDPIWTGTQNSNEEPMFINRMKDNYQIAECGVAFDTGNSTNAPSSSFDLNGNARIKIDQIDIGAYEIQRSDLRSQITPLIDSSIILCTPQLLEIEIPNSNPNVEYKLFKPELDVTAIGDGADLTIVSTENAETQNYLLTGSRTGANKLTFAANKRVTVPYSPEVALAADKDFTLEVGVNMNSVGGIERFYSQEGSIGIGNFGDEILITRYTFIDIVTDGVNLTANTDHVIKIEQKVIGPNQVRLFVSLDGVLKWTGTADFTYTSNTNDINIGGRPTSQWMSGTMDFIEIKKGNQIELRYDFTTGHDSETVYDYRFLNDGDTPRNGTMVGFTPATDWVVGIDGIANLCPVEGTYDVKVAFNPLNHYVTNANFDGLGTLKDLTGKSCPNDTIRFDPSLDNLNLVFLGSITTPHDLNFIGNGMDKTIWDGNNNSFFPIFNLPASHKILIKDLQITRAVQSSIGSFYISGDHTLENVLFKGYIDALPPFRLDGLSNLKIKGDLRIEN